ncbi:MAG TPA: hypothetical protein DDW50_13445 [Firmicutes bacterium]|jgi:two-component system, cell cycle response regulator|nr:hypothetical protein [Bacillota bacterium]
MSWINKLFHASKGKSRCCRSEIREHTLTWHAVKNTLTSLNGSFDKPESTKIMKLDIAPGREERWIFKVLSGIDQGREYMAMTKEIRVGRHPENLILLRDPKASRFHAIIYRKGPRLILEDLGSTNGTRVNGEIVSKKRTLFTGDLIKIGETLIRVSLEKG